MTHLIIKQNNGITEQVSPSVIEKLYEIVHSGNLDSCDLMGSLNTTNTYQHYVDYLEEQFTKNGLRQLIITANKLYIRFADPAIQSVLVSRFGDGIGVTISNLSSISQLPAGIFDYNTTIETFNELGQFTSITSMSYDCFRGCTNLRSIDLSNIQEFSSGNALNGCSKLGSDNNGILNLPKLNSTLGGSCLASCTSLVEVNIGSSVSSGNKISLIKNSTFASCTNLEKVTGLSEVTSLEGGVFYDCIKLKNLPDLNNSTALSIGDECFFDCFALKCIDLTSQTISFVGKNHFYRCGNLIDLSTNDYTQASSAVATYTFNWSTIPNGIFWQAAITNKSFNFPNATSIGVNAFSSSGVVGINSPNVTSIGNNAFNGCSSLTSIDLSNCTSIQWDAFNGCSSLTTVDLSNITFIDTRTFSGCSALTSVENLSNVTSIGTQAFQNCSSLTSIDIPNVTTINSSAFSGCTSLTTVNNIDNVTRINQYAFYRCSSLSSINLTGLTYLENDGFRECSSLTTISIPNCTYIGGGSFRDCTSLQSITFANNVTYIEGYMCTGCRNLTQVQLPSNMTQLMSAFFSGCTSLTSVTIPSTVTIIQDNVFRSTGITSISIPSSVTEIGIDCFTGSALTSITFEPNSQLTTLGGGCFNSCNLTTIDIPDSCTTMGSNIFIGSTTISNIIIGTGIQTIDRSFTNYSNYTLTIKATTPPTFNNTNCRKPTAIYVPSDSISTYQSASGWSNWADVIQAIPTT